MCLATVYNKTQTPESILLQFVSRMEVDGSRITLTDVMGDTKVVEGTIQSVALDGGTVVINCME